MIGSRGSRLALWQAEWVRSELQKHHQHLPIDIEIIKTTGDTVLDSPLSLIGDKGLFTKEIEAALVKKRIDLAVHSLKDLPTTLPDGLMIGAITKREDVHDVFIAHPKKLYRQLNDVPKGGIIATGSLRRTSQLKNWRPDIEIVDLRGNLNTRFAKLDASDWDGMILARAGVIRLGWENRITEIVPFKRILPAVGQGALGIEIREEDEEIERLLAPIVSRATTLATLGERAFLRFLEGGCQVPIGSYGRIEENEFVLDGMIGSLDGKKILRGKTHGRPEESEKLGRMLAKTLYESGGKKILESIRSPKTSECPLV
ncbi:MAG: hydroxymethylbilane synthase [Ignavibacteriae bacterium]|nr:hydroxymethylbilane synthase [Ignavibacteria bacterium]MBI3363950.1 hydroxymethylbilane synthase [Ignavibacteriota bacterium]